MLVTFVNLISPKWVQIVSFLANIGKIVGLIAIIGFGVYGLVLGRFENIVKPFENTNPEILAGVNAFYSGLFCYSGWNYLSYVVEEIVNPNR